MGNQIPETVFRLPLDGAVSPAGEEGRKHWPRRFPESIWAISNTAYAVGCIVKLLQGAQFTHLCFEQFLILLLRLVNGCD